MPVFRLFRHQAPPWRCGAGFNSEMFVRARCPLFFSGEKRAGGPLRGGAGRGSTRRCSYELDVRFWAQAPKILGRAAQGRAACGAYWFFRRTAFSAVPTSGGVPSFRTFPPGMSFSGRGFGGSRCRSFANFFSGAEFFLVRRPGTPGVHRVPKWAGSKADFANLC